MASTTPNLNLYKPDRTEYVSVITDLNNNWDIIDRNVVNVGNQTFTDLQKKQIRSNIELVEDVTVDFGTSEGTNGEVISFSACRTWNTIFVSMSVKATQSFGSSGAITIVFNTSLHHELLPVIDGMACNASAYGIKSTELSDDNGNVKFKFTVIPPVSNGDIFIVGLSYPCLGISGSPQ